MKLIVISYPENIPGEHDLLTSLFTEGLELFHLRKPNFTKNQLKEYIKLIPAKFHKNIIIHSHHELINDYKLKGLHFNQKNKHINDRYDQWNIVKSLSTHSLEEVMEVDPTFDYIFLSPIYNSISKSGYNSKFTISQLKGFFSSNTLRGDVIALGGISIKKITELMQTGFNGFALLGDIWGKLQSGETCKAVSNYFAKIYELCQNNVPSH